MTTRRDWLKWVAAACALVATMSAEYALARSCGYSMWVAWTVPGALDAYVLRALQARREVLVSVLAMVVVNAASHLVTAGMLPVRWWLVTAVAAVPALVLWRIHALRTPGEARVDVLHGVTEAQGQEARSRSRDAEPDTVNVPVTEPVPLAEPVTVTFEEHVTDVPGMLDYVPEDWSAGPVPVTPFTASMLEAPWREEHDGLATVTPLPLPAGFTASTEARDDTVTEDDMPAVNRLREHMTENGMTTVPGQGAIKAICGCGTDRARRVQKHVTETMTDGDGS